MSAGYADEERRLARKYDRADETTRLQAVRGLTAKPSLWRRIVWGER